MKAFALLLILVVLIAATALVFAAQKPHRDRRLLFEAVQNIIGQHAEQLAKRRSQLVRQDPYGKLVLDKWKSEVEYFIREHVRPSLSLKQQAQLETVRAEVERLVDLRAEEIVRSTPAFNAFSESMTAVEFEAFCADQLRSNGWDAKLTAASGDQGVDVIAEKAGMRVVLQCKLYSGAVGNGAIQEIVAGKAYERAHHCAVVTNNRYTPAAEQLASANGVFLLHYSELAKLESLIRQESTTPQSAFNFSGASLLSKQSSAAAPALALQQLPEKPDTIRHHRPMGLTKLVLFVAIVAIIIGGALVRYTGLISSKGESPEHMIAYTNDKFGYTILYPNSFAAAAVSDDGAGMTMKAPDGLAFLAVRGSNNNSRLTTKDYFEKAVEKVNGTLGYRKLGGSWFVVTWSDNQDRILYQKMFVGKGSCNSFVFTFPRKQRAKYQPIVTNIEKSFRPGTIDIAH